ncbi:hypothetical protein HMPREF9103_02156 [Lentilactobacillus parafarraginis F0439]|uniref:Uncharacterized protein n=1 Tax=Lentilactobacillus parafarraginis F0439 TaxID=797515 RepID=G9ZQZ8_9LACO|nr:hypothetical protein HMPREF9103_02156 [Lentilactobacillus parafarraginis F0439]
MRSHFGRNNTNINCISYHPYQFPKLQEQISHAINPGKTVFSLIFIF